MKVNNSNTGMSAIVKAGDELRKLQAETGNEYLFLNRGVNAVCNIDLSEVIETIDFNSNNMQVYPGSRGKLELRNAINDEFFTSQADVNNIIITSGGISGLDITFQNIVVDKVLLPVYFWGTYAKVMKIRNLDYDTYEDIFELDNIIDNGENMAVVICDPNNPLGDKYKDEDLIRTVKMLNDKGVTVIIDSPYRHLYFDKNDTYYTQIAFLKNVIIVDSFSKSIGLSGQRIGFVHSTNTEFISEFSNRILYATNGVNAFAQILVEKLLASPEGIKAVKRFKEVTVVDIKKNIEYLAKRNMLVDEFYKGKTIEGIFVAVNISEKILLENRIGSVSLSYFTEKYKEETKNYSRICVSVPSSKFIEFFDKIGK